MEGNTLDNEAKELIAELSKEFERVRETYASGPGQNRSRGHAALSGLQRYVENLVIELIYEIDQLHEGRGE